MQITLSCRSDGASRVHEGREEEAAEHIYGMVTEDGEYWAPSVRVKIYPFKNGPAPTWTFPTAARSDREYKAFFGWEPLYGVLRRPVLADGPEIRAEYVMIRIRHHPRYKHVEFSMQAARLDPNNPRELDTRVREKDVLTHSWVHKDQTGWSCARRHSKAKLSAGIGP